MIKVSQATGNLESGLKDCLEFYKKIQVRRKKLKEILSYPLMVLSFTILLVFLILFAIIPMFEGIYKSYGDDLPLLTKIVVFLSNGLRNNYLEIATLVVILLLLKKFSKQKWLSPLSLLNYFGNKLQHQLLDPFFFAYAINILLINAITLDSALKTASEMLTETNRKKATKIFELLHKGKTFCEACKEIDFYWKYFSIFLTTAEKYGNLALGFTNIYKYWDQKFDSNLKIITQISHFLIISLAALIILIIFLSVYLPIFEINTRGEFF